MIRTQDGVQLRGTPFQHTGALLQNTSQLAQMDLFGTEESNVKLVLVLKIDLEQHGHVVMINTVYQNQVLQLMYDVVWRQEEAMWTAAKSKTVSAVHIKQFCTNWLRENKEKINLNLDNSSDHFKFLHGINIVPSTSKHTIPLLQKVCQRDAGGR